MQSTETQVLNGNKIKGAKTTDFLGYNNILCERKLKLLNVGLHCNVLLTKLSLVHIIFYIIYDVIRFSYVRYMRYNTQSRSTRRSQHTSASL